MSLIPQPLAADTLLPCERIFRQSDRSRESREISRAFLLPFAIHARFQELKQPFFLFQRQCIRSCFDFSERAHDGRLPREAEHAKRKSAIARTPSPTRETLGACAPRSGLRCCGAATTAIPHKTFCIQRNRDGGCLFDDGHVDGVVREQDFADVAEQDAGCRLVIR